MNQQDNVSAATMVVKTQKCSELELEIAKLMESETQAREALERKYVEGWEDGFRIGAGEDVHLSMFTVGEIQHLIEDGHVPLRFKPELSGANKEEEEKEEMEVQK